MAGIIRKFTKRLIIICNIVVSICMLLLYVLPYTNQRHSWMINLFALAFPFLLFLQAGFFVFWLMAKRAMIWIPVTTFIVCWSLVTNFFGFHIKGAKLQKPGDAFRIATFNSHLFNFFENKGALDPAMIEKIKTLNADVFAAQEFVFSLDSSSPITLERAKQKLGFQYVVAANDRAFGVHTNLKQKTERYHPFCVVIFSNHPIIRWQKVQSLKEYNHTFLWADILFNSDTVRIFSIHLQSMHFAKDDYAFIENINDKEIDEVQRAGFTIMRKMKVAYLLRAAQAREVKAEIEKSPYPVIVCGDMNDVPNSYSYQTIGSNLKDAYAEKGRGVGRTFKFLSPTLRIDYIFHSTELELNQVQVIRPSLSDHNPVVADFSFQKK
jgi:endonuclease/exonuclease/phosphatase family metal-dependent hydrolase